MARTFPLSVADFQDLMRFEEVTFRLEKQEVSSGYGSGEWLTKKIGPDLWAATVRSLPMDKPEAFKLRSRLNQLGSMEQFYLYCTDQAYPSFDPDGSKFTSGSVLATGDIAVSANFAAGSYTYEGQSVTQSVILGCARSSSRVIWDATLGEYVSFGSNTPAISSGELYLPVIPGTNYCTVSDNTQTGSDLPADWEYISESGLTNAVVNSGVEDGLPFLDVRFQGTPSTDPQLRFNATTALAVSQGDEVTFSLFCRRVGGDMTNLNKIDIRAVEINGGFIDATTDAFDVEQASLALSRDHVTRTVSDPSATHATGRIRLDWSAGPIDITLRIACPQLELAASPSDPIVGNAGPTARAAETLTVSALGTNDFAFTTDQGAEAIPGVSGDLVISNDNGRIITDHRGPERMINPDFATGDLTGWIDASTPPSSITVESNAAVHNVPSGDNARVRQSFPIQDGAYYETAVVMAVGSDITWGIGNVEGNAGLLAFDTDSPRRFEASGTTGWFGSISSVNGRAIASVSTKLIYELQGVRCSAFSASRVSGPGVAPEPEINTINVNRKELSLIKLPPFYELKEGELISVTYDTSRVAILEAAEDVSANSGGQTQEFEVRPHLRPGIASGARVEVIKASGKFKMIPETADVVPVDGLDHRVIFNARQTLGKDPA